MSPPAFQRAKWLAKRIRLVYSFRRLTLRSATGMAQRASPYLGAEVTVVSHSTSTFPVELSEPVPPLPGVASGGGV
jgi:hypothetical protein